MIDYSKWEMRKLSVDGMLLDNENPRLPEEMLKESQRAILHYLVNNFKILEIAKSIAKNGFFINETPIVAKKGNRYVVVEGNRRLAALKLLRNPDLAPPRKKFSYVRLAEDIDIERLKKLAVYIAPSKEDVAPILIARHGTEMTSPWQRLMKIRFLAGEVLKGVPYETIAENYSVGIAEVRTAAMTILIRDIIRYADISDEKKDSYLSEKFPTSTLTRIVQRKRFVKLSGLDIEGTKLKYKIPDEEFLNVILAIFRDIVKGDVTARSHENEQERNAYIESLFAKYTSGTKGDYNYQAPVTDENNDKQKPRKPRPRRRAERLIPETQTFCTGNKKLDNLLAEGQKITVGSYVHASGLLLRAVLDLTVQRIYDINGKIEETKLENGKTRGLTKRINFLISNHKEWLQDHSTCEKLRRFTAKNSGSFVHIETLNDYAHGNYGNPTKEDLSNFWAHIEPLIDLVLEEF